MNEYRKEKQAKLFFAVLILLTPVLLTAQTPSADSLLQEVTLPDAIAYAIKKQPVIQQSLLDEKITSAQIKSKLADWYPQVNFDYNLQHNFLLPTSVIGGNPVKVGFGNTSSGQFTATQNIFNREVMLVKRAKNDVMLQAKQSTS